MNNPARVFVPLGLLAFASAMSFAVYLQLRIWHVIE